MSKKEQLMEYITQDIIAFSIEDYHWNIKEAMHKFYTSKTYEKLADEETGCYLEGSASVYEIFKDEIASGKIVQNEF